jgi:hypothetical protein
VICIISGFLVSIILIFDYLIMLLADHGHGDSRGHNHILEIIVCIMYVNVSCKPKTDGLL